MLDLPFSNALDEADAWGETGRAAVLALGTFLSEDATTISAALLARSARLLWSTAFWGCFSGIWISDTALYTIARLLGRRLLEHHRVGKWVKRESIQRSEAWFASKGLALLVGCRFMPGTRLPTYLAAGFLKLHLGHFLIVTGVMAALWTGTILGIAHRFGDQILGWTDRWRFGSLGVVGLVVVALLLFRGLVGLRQPLVRAKLHGRLGRWTRWEFWPAWLFYWPVAVCYLFLALRHRSLLAPTAANPLIFSGGFVGESKMATLQDLMAGSPEFTARAWLLPVGSVAARSELLTVLRERHGIGFPFILKPDVGQRGMGVKLIRTNEEAWEHLGKAAGALVVQEYARGPLEAGVFYYRHPGTAGGRIFAITRKVFPEIVGDGASTIEELIWLDRRARFMAGKYLQRLDRRRREVLPAGERLRLVEAGNHAQGCIFEDGIDLRTTALERRIDQISKSVPEFYFGRFDLRYESEADLKAGLRFKIVELNGAASEATSIYDARNSLASAYGTLFRQWDLVFAIGVANQRRGTVTTAPGVLFRKWREARRAAVVLPVAD